MDKENVVHLYNGVLLSTKKKWHLEIFMQMIRASKNYPEWGNPDTERQTQCVLNLKWILDLKQRIASQLSITPERTEKK